MSSKQPGFCRVKPDLPKVKYANIWMYYQSSKPSPAQQLSFLPRQLFIVTEDLTNSSSHYARDIFDLYRALQVAPPPRLRAVL